MEFEDKNINELNLNNSEDFYSLITDYLCGSSECEKWDNVLKMVKENISKVIKHIDTSGINYQQFNEILLLIGEDRVSKAFFDFFLGKENGDY